MSIFDLPDNGIRLRNGSIENLEIRVFDLPDKIGISGEFYYSNDDYRSRTKNILFMGVYENEQLDIFFPNELYRIMDWGDYPELIKIKVLKQIDIKVKQFIEG